MKKTYISPSVNVVRVQAANMLALSYDTDTKAKTSPGDVEDELTETKGFSFDTEDAWDSEW